MTAQPMAPTTAAPAAAARPSPKLPVGGGPTGGGPAGGGPAGGGPAGGGPAGGGPAGGWPGGSGGTAVTADSSFGHDEANRLLEVLEHLRDRHPAGEQGHHVGEPDLADDVRDERVVLALRRRRRVGLGVVMRRRDDADEHLAD